MKVRTCFCLAVVSLLSLVCATMAASQTTAAQPQAAATPAATGTLRGQVTDPSGAAIASANVVMTPAAISSTPITTQANGQGSYEFKGLPAGQYTLTVVAPGFSVYENDNVVHRRSAAAPQRCHGDRGRAPRKFRSLTPPPPSM